MYLYPTKTQILEFTLNNKGTLAEQFAINATSLLGWANVSEFPTEVLINSGESMTIKIAVSIPMETESGLKDLLTVNVISSTNPLISDSAETEIIASSVKIDIKPDSVKNPINGNSKLIPVAILGSSSFDVYNVNQSLLFFGPKGTTPVHLKYNQLPSSHYEDVNSDGYYDLITHFSTQASGIASESVIEACLSGETNEGISFGDCERIEHVGKKVKKVK